MKFAEFLNEESSPSHIKTIDLETALSDIKTHCKNTKFEMPFIRAMNGTDDAYILQGENGVRKSITHMQYNIKIIDEITRNISRRYPLRSKSTICSGPGTDASHHTKFGPNIYAIFPYDDVVIGYLTRYHDLNYARLDVHGDKEDIGNVSENFKWHKIDSESYEGMVNDIFYVANGHIAHGDDNDVIYKMFQGMKTKDEIREALTEYYGPDSIGYGFGTTEDIYSRKIYKKECWIGGKCIAIKYDVWMDIKDSMK